MELRNLHAEVADLVARLRGPCDVAGRASSAALADLFDIPAMLLNDDRLGCALDVLAPFGRASAWRVGSPSPVGRILSWICGEATAGRSSKTSLSKGLLMSEKFATPSSRVPFRYVPHPRIQQRKQETPPLTADERVGINGRIGVFITSVVGTMWAAYLFTLLALVSLPAAISTGAIIIIVAWVAQTFLQLVLLPVIIVGQNVQARTADRRAQQTYRDAEAILHECQILQAHLQAQDTVLDDVIRRLETLSRSGR